ncbi:WPP domain-associated protein [Dichanthelium oligosanthes]|uniref:WPP domain-associated protein n=1 Tax=Dichanthelium oligosanthes TaxID=888268 RepID=A0A1E5WML4_9POAL|nr:WPP domain-associated protein [Dichanthelium oligosanthes]
MGRAGKEAVSIHTHSRIDMAETLDVSPDDANGSAAVQIELSCDKEAFLEDMDSYLDEVNTRFHVSGVVTGAVIKEVLSDLKQEAASQIAFKDAEIASLNQKLQLLGNGNLSLSDGRDKRHDEFHSIRQQLDSISKSLLNSEWGLSGSQHNFEGSENVAKQKDKEKSSGDGVARKIRSQDSEEEVFGDPKLLDHMDKVSLIAHFNKSMNEMKRQHDSVVYGMTEEIFKLKRENLKKDGSNPFHLRNNKELEQMRKKIEEAISKLDVLLLENKRTFVRIKSDAIPGQQDNSTVVYSDIQQLEGGPTHPSHFASGEADHEMNIRRLESDIEDSRIAATIREEVERIVMKELISEIKIGLHGYEMELDMRQEFCSIIQNEAIGRAKSNIDSLLLKYKEKKGCAEEESIQKQKIEKLKLIVDSFTKVVREKEEFVSQIGLQAMEARVGSLCRELDLLRDKVGKQDSYISEKNREFDIMVSRLEQAQQHVQNNDTILGELNDKFRTVSDSLKQLEKQNQVLHTIIEEKEKTLTSAISKDKELKEFMDNVVKSMGDFEKSMTDQQTIVANKVQHSESRFCLLKEQCKHLVKEGNLLRKKALRYREISETRGSNLQKAELEVMETLNLIKKHISMAK